MPAPPSAKEIEETMVGGVTNLGSMSVASPQESLSGQASGNIDQKVSSTTPKFGDVYQQIQAKYGQKAEKPREAKKTLGKDDFMRIMITQMKNQDPTNPFKAEQMATQVAQFTSVEQLQNVNQNLNKMGSQNKPIEQMVMTGMIGKTVTIDRDRFPHTEGENDSLGFTLPKSADSTVVSVINGSGEVVFTKDLGKQNAGEVNWVWDGLKNNSLPAKTGDYTIRVEAKDERGQTIPLSSKAQARVIGVSFEGLEPVLLVGDSAHQEKITMRNIVRVDQDQSQANRSPGIVGEKLQGSGAGNFMPFSMKTGFSPAQGTEGNSVSEPEKGFPNGLKGGEDS